MNQFKILLKTYIWKIDLKIPLKSKIIIFNFKNESDDATASIGQSLHKYHISI
jgi:hypothetical protein